MQELNHSIMMGTGPLSKKVDEAAKKYSGSSKLRGIVYGRFRYFGRPGEDDEAVKQDLIILANDLYKKLGVQEGDDVIRAIERLGKSKIRGLTQKLRDARNQSEKELVGLENVLPRGLYITLNMYL